MSKAETLRASVLFSGGLGRAARDGAQAARHKIQGQCFSRGHYTASFKWPVDSWKSVQLLHTVHYFQKYYELELQTLFLTSRVF